VSDITAAAIKWHDIRIKIFSKEKTDMTDWNQLSECEHDLMKAVKENK
jgi:hypothetical protein